MIENERNPSWVPLVTLFLPVVQVFLLFRQSQASGPWAGRFSYSSKSLDTGTSRTWAILKIM